MDGKQTYLGIELGSTRIKAVLIDEHHHVIAQGNHTWENQMCDGIWTYSLESIIKGLQDCYKSLKDDVKQKYQITLETVGGIGISAMMHGYLVLDKQDELLVPFRTWRNTMTQEASEKLTTLFSYHIPQRWSIAHLYQAMLHQEAHVPQIAFQTTLAGYVHYVLTGKKVLGIGEASGMFPINSETKTYDEKMVKLFNDTICQDTYSWKLEDIMPTVLQAGEDAGYLTKEGALLLDPSGDLQEGIPLCPPEGDAQTGMVATNSIQPKSGNVSAGTSVFAMVVLERALQHVYEAIDLVTTPEGHPVAMVHCNNGTSELTAWVSLFQELLKKLHVDVAEGTLYELLFQEALQGEVNGGGLSACNYLSGEHITGFASGCPMFVRSAEGNFNLANFMLTQMYSAFATLKIGMDILIKEEHVAIDQMFGHGGFFKTPEVGQKIMAAVMRAPISVMKTAGEGGAWGSAVLAAYRSHKEQYENLNDYLEQSVFAETQIYTLKANPQLQDGFDAFMDVYKAGLKVEQAAVEQLASPFKKVTKKG